MRRRGAFEELDGVFGSRIWPGTGIFGGSSASQGSGFFQPVSEVLSPALGQCGYAQGVLH